VKDPDVKSAVEVLEKTYEKYASKNTIINKFVDEFACMPLAVELEIDPKGTRAKIERGNIYPSYRKMLDEIGKSAVGRPVDFIVISTRQDDFEKCKELEVGSVGQCKDGVYRLVLYRNDVIVYARFQA
jgi:hypothetical protein